MKLKSRMAVSTIAVVIVIVVIVVAAGGVAAYLLSTPPTTTVTATSTSTAPPTTTSTSTAPPTTTSTSTAPPTTTTSTALQTVTYSTDYLTGGKQTGIYVAQYLGYYKAAGLSVSVTTTQGGLISANLVADGKANFGMTDVTDVMQLDSQGANLVIIYLNVDNSPAGYISLASSNITKPTDIDNHKLLCQVGETECNLFPAFAQFTGINQNTVTKVNVAPALYVSALLQHQVDVIPFYINSNGPVIMSQVNQSVNIMRWSSYGWTQYTTCVVTTRSLINSNPSLVAAFVNATMHGYEYAFQNLQTATDIVVAANPTLSSGVTLQQLQGTLQLSETSNFQTNGYGWIDSAKMNSTVTLMSPLMNITQPLQPNNLYDNTFLKGSTFPIQAAWCDTACQNAP